MFDKSVILLDRLVGRYGDFTARFKIGAITDHFMINLLCEVLMDVHHSSLDTTNETSARAMAKLEALEVRIADLKKLLRCVYV
ncbi:hypothetical protein CMV_021350 [Castanea mollissima]|uniref:Uncharacterized protein n=1 Tax=Castanea mollissima TaxID=60419 RepID=A0A8J4QJZ9_9ROSI|nr:hypothetical protein CMV_021350 [Castanea mollissima]